jgi:hypothetical protein
VLGRFQMKLVMQRQLVAETVPLPLGIRLQFRTHFAVILLNEVGELQAHVPSGTSVALSSTLSTFVQSRSHVLNSLFHVYAAAHSQASIAVLVLVAFTTAVQLIPHVLSVLFHINFSTQTQPAVVAAIY